jgi:hypothetical protein
MDTLHRIGREHAVLIPVTVVLMPRPRAADPRVLHDHLGVIVICLVAEQLLHRVHQLAAAGEHPVDAVAGMVPKGQPDAGARAVIPAEGVLVEHAILVRRAAEEIDLLPVKEFPRDDEAVAVIGGDLPWGEVSLFHGGWGWEEWEA